MHGSGIHDTGCRAGCRAGYRIGEVSERTGIAPTTLRFYEETSVVPRAARDASGYRRYTDRDVARLRFVARAKQLGCSLDEITALVEHWEADDCSTVNAALRTLVSANLAQLGRRIVDEKARVRELDAVAGALSTITSDGPCDESCACAVAVAPAAPAAPDRPVVACTLTADRIDDRVDEWRTVLDGVRARTSVPGGIRLTFESDAALPEVVRLAVAEQSCCSFLEFTFTIDHRGPAMEVVAPPDGRAVVEMLFGPATGVRETPTEIRHHDAARRSDARRR